MKHLLTLKDVERDEIEFLIEKGIELKEKPEAWANSLRGKILLMIFAKPSLRTRLSFEVGMFELGGHAIYYDISTSPLGKGKESISDTAKGASQFVDIIMARLFEQSDLETLAKFSEVPVINGLTNFEHPCQILADLMTVKEKFGRLKGLKLAYFGDGNNNIAHSFLFSCPKIGMHLSIASPEGKDFEPQPEVVKFAKECAEKNKVEVVITHNPNEAIKNADIVVTDSWMSYHIPKELEPERIRIFSPYQVNSGLMKRAKSSAIFMHCLPATRGQEVTDDVMDSPQSVIWQEAENRLHIQKAILLRLLGKL